MMKVRVWRQTDRSLWQLRTNSWILLSALKSNDVAQVSNVKGSIPHGFTKSNSAYANAGTSKAQKIPALLNKAQLAPN